MISAMEPESERKLIGDQEIFDELPAERADIHREVEPPSATAEK